MPRMTCLSFPITKRRPRSGIFASSLFPRITDHPPVPFDSPLSKSTSKALYLRSDQKFRTRTRRCCRLLCPGCSIPQYPLYVTPELRRDGTRSPLDAFRVREVLGGIVVPYQHEALCAWVTRMVSDLQARPEHVFITQSNYADTRE